MRHYKEVWKWKFNLIFSLCLEELIYWNNNRKKTFHETVCENLLHIKSWPLEIWLLSGKWKPNEFGSSLPEVLLGKGVLKICKKFTGEYPCRSVILIKLLCNFTKMTLRHGCSFVNLLHIFRAPFPKNNSGGLLLRISENRNFGRKFRNRFKRKQRFVIRTLRRVA